VGGRAKLREGVEENEGAENSRYVLSIDKVLVLFQTDHPFHADLFLFALLTEGMVLLSALQAAPRRTQRISSNLNGMKKWIGN